MLFVAMPPSPLPDMHVASPRACPHDAITIAGKLAGLDKKLSRSLEADVQEGSSPQEMMGKSPVGPLSESSRWATLLARRSWRTFPL